MTIPLWTSILVAIVAGLFGGVIGPVVTDWLGRRSWKGQKRLELKYEAFQSALRAVAAWEADALDIALQRDKPSHNDTTAVVETRDSTKHALTYAQGLVEAHFSPPVVERFMTLVRSHISIDNVPSTEFEQCRKEFVAAASSEMGLSNDEGAA